MQKKIIVLAIAAALSAPAVVLADAANVTPYGVADVSVDFISTGTGITPPATAAASGTSKMVVSSNASHFGLKGSEDLDGGLTAIWQIESQVNIDNAGGTFGTRNTFAGLKGSFGTVLLGRNDSPYKSATRKLDVFANGLADNRSLMGAASTTVPGNTANSFDSRPADAISYLSPTFGAFTVAIQRANAAETNTLSTQAKGDTLSLAAMYNAGPVYAALATESHNTKPNVGASTSDKAMKLGVGYTRDALNVGLVYEKVSGDFTANKHNAIYVGAKFAVAGGAVKAAITKKGQLNSVANTGARQISLGYDHSLSKRTTAYVAYTKMSNEDGATNALSTGGTSSATGTVNGAGSDPSAISFGLKHAF